MRLRVITAPRTPTFEPVQLTLENREELVLLTAALKKATTTDNAFAELIFDMWRKLDDEMQRQDI